MKPCKKMLKMKIQSISFLIFPTILVIVVYLSFQFGTATLQDKQGINTLEKVKLGGMDQWISIRGKNPNAPVLLFLHGGPGSANLAKLRQQVPDLENHFVVVTWDQRGAGKSATPGFDYSSLSVEQMVTDAHELVQFLKNRFGKEKIYLMGFSWGTVIGLTLAERFPQDFYAYIGVSQIVDMDTSERQSLIFVQQTAIESNNLKAISALKKIDPSYTSIDWYEQLTTERAWLLRFNGVYNNTNNYAHEIWMMLKAPEYSIIDFSLWPGRSSQSLKSLWPEVMKINFSQTINRLQLPVYFFVGRYDHNISTLLAASFYDQLDDTEGKQIVWFKNSAHDIFFDEPRQIEKEIIKVLEESK